MNHLSSRRAELEALLAPMPKVRTSQRALCRIAWSVRVAAESTRSASPAVRSVEGARLERELGRDIAEVCPQMQASDDAPATLEELVDWSIAACEDTTGAT